jgi:hypothetical protein
MHPETAVELPPRARDEHNLFSQGCRRQSSVPSDEQHRIDGFVVNVENSRLEAIGTSSFEVALKRNRLLTVYSHDQLAQNSYVLHVEALCAFGADLSVVARKRFGWCTYRSHKSVKRRLAHGEMGLARSTIPRPVPIGVLVNLQNASLSKASDLTPALAPGFDRVINIVCDHSLASSWPRGHRRRASEAHANTAPAKVVAGDTSQFDRSYAILRSGM